MSMRFRALLVPLLVCLGPLGLWARVSGPRLNVAFMHNKVGIPFLNSPFGYRLFPGFLLGTEFRYIDRDRFDLLGTVVAKGSFHPGSPYGSVFSVGSEVVPRLELPNGVYFDAIAGLHYSHVFSNLATLTLSQEGVTQRPDWGRPGFSLNLGLSAGYDFSRLTGLRLRVFLRCDADITYAPGAQMGLISLLPTTTLMVGTQIDLGKARP